MAVSPAGMAKHVMVSQLQRAVSVRFCRLVSAAQKMGAWVGPVWAQACPSLAPVEREWMA